MVQSITHSTEPTTPRSLHITAHSAASSIPQWHPTTICATTARNALAIAESCLWHRFLAHNNHAAAQSEIDGYPKDDTMCHACIQATHKQKIIRVKNMCTAQQIELVHPHDCWSFSMPISIGYCNYILCIVDYRHHDSMWVLSDHKSKKWASSYKSLPGGLNSK